MDLTHGEVDHGLTLGKMELGTTAPGEVDHRPNSMRGRPWNSLLERWTLELTLGKVDHGPYSRRGEPWNSLLESWTLDLTHGEVDHWTSLLERWTTLLKGRTLGLTNGEVDHSLLEWWILDLTMDIGTHY